MSQPIRFTVCVGLMLLSFAIPLCFYQQQGSEVAYKRLVFWERLGMLLGIIGLLGAAPG